LGIQNLESKLVKLFDEAMQKNVPLVKEEIKKKITETKAKILALGDPLDSAPAKRLFFTKFTRT
jgi:uncharacterized membrane protein required for colicin V production